MLQSVEKLNKTCVLKFTRDKIFLIVSKIELTELQVWGQVAINLLFEDFIIESANNNEIWLEVRTDQIIRVLKSAQSAIDVYCKLTKKTGLPSLSFNIKSIFRGDNPVLLVQDIPIRVLNMYHISEYKEPMVPQPHVHILMPPLVSVRTIIDRMKSMSNYLTISANYNGEFTLKIETESVSVETYFKDLICPELNQNENSQSQQERPKEQFSGCQISIIDFEKFVHSYVINPSSVICSIIENFAVVFYVYVRNDMSLMDYDQETRQFGALTYYIPAIIA
ncbi:cell cycle checkpoint [Piromyces finnis]|uniref:Checkpoint protein n=1 Tax=Piromyces finnis TaxID=1754191 RepID=A0A1Y1VN73_9FUNG|nr:cell cycle checkpoint [Piromyces finnis]|eukprot:ORX60072.1 cell cycle checkpoint [Piromyces finnis]